MSTTETKRIADTTTPELCESYLRKAFPETVKRIENAARASLEAKGAWEPIETAPKDGNPILLLADDREYGYPNLTVIAHWGCEVHAFSSAHQCNRHPSDDCRFRWMGGMAERFGRTFSWWMPLPPAPSTGTGIAPETKVGVSPFRMALEHTLTQKRDAAEGEKRTILTNDGPYDWSEQDQLWVKRTVSTHEQEREDGPDIHQAAPAVSRSPGDLVDRVEEPLGVAPASPAPVEEAQRAAHNVIVLARHLGLPAQPRTPETDADPRNPEDNALQKWAGDAVEVIARLLSLLEQQQREIERLSKTTYLEKLEADWTVIGDVSSSELSQTRMAKSVLDAGWYTLKMQLAYKAIGHGGCCYEVNEAWTSRTCSSCGAIPDSSPKGIAALGIREWTCDCGAVHDRDVNAARNILRLGQQALAEGAAQMRSCQIPLPLAESSKG